MRRKHMSKETLKSEVLDAKRPLQGFACTLSSAWLDNIAR